jgi:hypothetical protein
MAIFARACACMGRKPQFPERIIATLARGTLSRIANVLERDEERTAFIRRSVDEQIKKREKAKRRDDDR